MTVTLDWQPRLFRHLRCFYGPARYPVYDKKSDRDGYCRGCTHKKSDTSISIRQDENVRNSRNSARYSLLWHKHLSTICSRQYSKFAWARSFEGFIAVARNNVASASW